MLVDKSINSVNIKLKSKRKALESKGFKKDRIYMDYNFSGFLRRVQITVRIEAQQIPQRDSFYYLGLVIKKDGKIDEDGKHDIKRDG